MAKTGDNRAFVAGKYALDMGGQHAGWLHSAEGGQPKAEVTVEKLGPDHIAKKHIAGVKYEDITVVCGTGMSEQFYKWIQDSFQHKYSRKDGAVIRANYDYEEMSRRNFFHALISEVGLPALDAASKDASKMTIKFTPETTRELRSFGKTKVSGPINQKVQKDFLPSNFRLSIDGLDEATHKVNKIEALVVKQKNVSHDVGTMRDMEKEPASVEFPNLVITLPESHADGFLKWFEDFVIKGNSGDEHEKNGHLEYLSNNLQSTLFTVQFKHLGVFAITPDKAESHSDNIARVKIEMYCEEMDFTWQAKMA